MKIRLMYFMTTTAYRSSFNIFKILTETHHLPYILESNPHTFYSFRGLKCQMWIRIGAQYFPGRELDFGKMIEPLFLP